MTSIQRIYVRVIAAWVASLAGLYLLQTIFR